MRFFGRVMEEFAALQSSASSGTTQALRVLRTLGLSTALLGLYVVVRLGVH